MRGTLILGLAGLLAACATTTRTITSEERARIGVAAQACQREYPIERYEIDRFGQVTAFYRPTNPGAASPEPFFACLRGKLGSGSQ